MKRLFLKYRQHLAEFGYNSPAAFLRWAAARLPETIEKKRNLLLEKTLSDMQHETFDTDRHEILQMEAWLELVRSTYALIENDYSFTQIERWQTPWMKLLMRLRNMEKT